MPVLIDTVRISNFRLFRNVEISLSRFTLLVGMNNAGKTSLLRALQIAFSGTRFMTEDDFAIGVEGRKIVIDTRTVPMDDAYKNRLPKFDTAWGDHFTTDITEDSSEREFFAFRTTISFDTTTNQIESKRSVLKDWKPFEDWQNNMIESNKRPDLKPIHFHFKEAQRDIQDDLRSRSSDVGRLLADVKFDEAMQEELDKQIQQLNADAVVGSKDLSALEHHLKKLQGTINSPSGTVGITPFTKNVRDLAKGINIHLQDNEKESLPLEYHGMGTRSWASLLAFNAFISRQSEKASEKKENHHALLALEEPEAHLHPNAQRTLYSQLRTMTGQQIVSTHSPYIAAQCELDEIRYFCKTADGAQIRSLNTSAFSKEDQRKLRREVLNTRGELLFARAIVLGEGETEEQALPIFAEKYWGKPLFELGINAIGVGGEGNYTPFLRMAYTLGIPWFIFSDGEQNARSKLSAALAVCGISEDLSHPNIVILDEGQSFEKYLWGQGYEKQLRKSRVCFELQNDSSANCHATKAVMKRVYEYSQEEFFTKIGITGKRSKVLKTKLAPLYAEIISNLPDGRKFPPAICTIFEKISDELRLPRYAADTEEERNEPIA